jgi:hypothetical protein
VGRVRLPSGATEWTSRLLDQLRRQPPANPRRRTSDPPTFRPPAGRVSRGRAGGTGQTGGSCGRSRGAACAVSSDAPAKPGPSMGTGRDGYGRCESETPTPVARDGSARPKPLLSRACSLGGWKLAAAPIPVVAMPPAVDLEVDDEDQDPDGEQESQVQQVLTKRAIEEVLDERDVKSWILGRRGLYAGLSFGSRPVLLARPTSCCPPGRCWCVAGRPSATGKPLRCRPAPSLASSPGLSGTWRGRLWAGQGGALGPADVR